MKFLSSKNYILNFSPTKLKVSEDLDIFGILFTQRWGGGIFGVDLVGVVVVATEKFGKFPRKSF